MAIWIFGLGLSIGTLPYILQLQLSQYVEYVANIQNYLRVGSPICSPMVRFPFFAGFVSPTFEDLWEWVRLSSRSRARN